MRNNDEKLYLNMYKEICLSGQLEDEYLNKKLKKYINKTIENPNQSNTNLFSMFDKGYICDEDFLKKEDLFWKNNKKIRNIFYGKLKQDNNWALYCILVKHIIDLPTMDDLQNSEIGDVKEFYSNNIKFDEFIENPQELMRLLLDSCLDISWQGHGSGELLGTRFTKNGEFKKGKDFYADGKTAEVKGENGILKGACNPPDPVEILNNLEKIWGNIIDLNKLLVLPHAYKKQYPIWDRFGDIINELQLKNISNYEITKNLCLSLWNNYFPNKNPKIFLAFINKISFTYNDYKKFGNEIYRICGILGLCFYILSEHDKPNFIWSINKKGKYTIVNTPNSNNIEDIPIDYYLYVYNIPTIYFNGGPKINLINKDPRHWTAQINTK